MTLKVTPGRFLNRISPKKQVEFRRAITVHGSTIRECKPVEISDQDVLEAMKAMQGYLDIKLSDFRVVYQVAYHIVLYRPNF